MNRWELSRRDLIKSLGLGAAALPLLHASAHAASELTRLVCVVQTGGYWQPSWKPPVGPLASTLPGSSAPLEPLRNDILYVTNLSDAAYPAGRTGYGAYSTLFYGLPTVGGTGEFREPAGKTVDQVVADALAVPAGARPSLALQVQVDLPPSSGGLLARRCFWRGPGQPITPQGDPRLLYGELFAGAVDPVQTQALIAERKSVLDYVSSSLAKFRDRLGTEDRAIIDGHLEATRSLEQQLLPLSGGNCRPGQPQAIDLIDPAMYGNILSAQMDIAVAALRCGVTRVLTLQLTDASAANVTLDLPGIPSVGGPPRSWREIAQNPVVGGVNHKVILDKWLMTQLGTLLARLKGTLDAGGSLLENCTVLWANTMEDGASHNPQKLPWILAGRGGSAFRTGQHVDAKGEPSSRVLASLCSAVGVPGQVFGPASALLGP